MTIRIFGGAYLVNEGETLSVSGEPAFLVNRPSTSPEPVLTIAGTVVASGTSVGIEVAYGSSDGGLVHVTSSGRLSVTGGAGGSSSIVYGYYSPSWGPDVQNDGVWEVVGAGTVYGFKTWDDAHFVNTGLLDVRGGDFDVTAISAQNGGTVINDGRIHARGAGFVYGIYADSWGVDSADTIVNNGEITLVVTGSGIYAASTGILVGGPGGMIVNTGSITAMTAISSSLSNNYSPMLLSPEWVRNEGRIEGDIELHRGRDILENTSTGVIIGDIDLGDGGSLVDNAGSITGDLWLGSGYEENLFDGRMGSYTGTLWGGSGNDRIYAGAGDAHIFGDGFIDGGAGADVIEGGNRRDDLRGGDGDDVVRGGRGDGDLLSGGAGNDVFQFKRYDGHDTVADFVPGEAGERLVVVGYGAYAELRQVGADTLVVLSDIDTILLKGVDAASLRASNFVFQDAEPSFPPSSLPPPLLDDLVVGYAAAQTIDTGDGNDLVHAGAGEDVVFGGAGDDRVDGGAGDDIVIGGAGADQLFGGDGADVLRGDLADPAAVPPGVYADDNDDSLYGGSGDDRLIGGVGADRLFGDDGDDVLEMGAGDTVDGGAGFDTAVIDLRGHTSAKMYGGGVWFEHGENAGGGLHPLERSYLVDWAPLFTIVGVERYRLLGSDKSDHFRAGDFDDELSGGGGGDWLDGAAGADLLVGGGANDTLIGGDGDDRLVGDGAGAPVSADVLQGGAGRDVIFGDDATVDNPNAGGGGDDTISGGAGDDMLYGEGGHDQIGGGDGDDVIYGGTGVDVLDGGTGNDILIGGDGGDTLTGGAGNDLFRYVAGYGQLVITDFAAGGADDVIEIFGFTGYQSLEQDGADTRVVLGDGGVILLKNVQAASLTAADFRFFAATLTGTESADALVGTQDDDVILAGAGDDLVVGGLGDDRLDGGDGDDRLEAGLGADRLDGGAGNDVLIGGRILNGGDGDDDLFGGGGVGLGVRVDGGAGADRVGGGLGAFIDGGTNPADAPDTLVMDLSNLGIAVTVNTAAAAAGAAQSLGFNTNFVNIERLDFTGTTSGDRITGWIYGDIIRGGRGDDTIDGGAGDDWLVGGDGFDRLTGGLGVDTADYSDATAGITANLTTGWAVGGAGTGTDALATIENLTGSSYVDVLTGADGANALNGGDGNDVLTGMAGDDVLGGGGGDDVMDGGAGADRLDGGAGIDQASYANAASAVAVNLTSGVHTGEANGDVFVSIERFGLSRFGDQFTGSAAADEAFGDLGNDTLFGATGNDVLDGGAGNDILRGGLGADRLIGGDGTDQANYQVATAAVTLNLTTGVHTGEAAGDTFESIERFVLSGYGDQFTGSASADEAVGYYGNDILFGAGGNDKLDGGNGNDILRGGEGADQLIGGTGTDTASCQLATSAVSLNLTTGVHTGEAAGDTFESIERFALSTLNDSFIGSAGADWVDGWKGADVLDGQGGADEMFGNEGNDQLFGGTGNDKLHGDGGLDVLYGDAGADVLYGGTGADQLFGGDDGDFLWGEAGNDTLTGGAGADRFAFSTGSGVDVITDFVRGQDKIILKGMAGIDDFSDVRISADAHGWAVITWGDGTSTVTLSGIAAAQVSASDVWFTG